MKKALQSVLAVSAIAAAGLHQALAEKYERDRADSRTSFAYFCSDNNGFVLTYDPISRGHTISAWRGKNFQPEHVVVLYSKGGGPPSRPSAIQASYDSGTPAFTLMPAGGSSYLLSQHQQSEVQHTPVECRIENLR